jgi:hypothetical protein
VPSLHFFPVEFTYVIKRQVNKDGWGKGRRNYRRLEVVGAMELGVVG